MPQNPTFVRDAPLIQRADFLIDFGPTLNGGIDTFLSQFREALKRTVEPRGLPVPVEVAAFGKESGRMVVRVFAPDPRGVVEAARDYMDDGPAVLPL